MNGTTVATVEPTRMASANDMDLITDVVIPSSIILVLFIINAFIFAFIMRKRKEIVHAEPTARDAVVYSTPAEQLTHQTDRAEEVVDNSCAIEMERL